MIVRYRLIMIFLLGSVGARHLGAEPDFWLVPGGEGKPQVRVILGGGAGIRMVDLGEESDEVDDRGAHWKARYGVLVGAQGKGGYVLTRHLNAPGRSSQNFIKAFDSHDKVRFTLGPQALEPLAMSVDCTRLALGRVSGPPLSQKVDFLGFTDAKGGLVYKESAPIETRVRLSPNGDWAAYVVNGDLVIRQFSTGKVYRRSLVEVATRSGSPMVRSFAFITDDGLLKYQFKTVGAYKVQRVDSDVWMKTYDPKEGEPTSMVQPVASGQILVKGWRVDSMGVSGHNLYMSEVSGTGFKKMNDAPIIEGSFLVSGLEVGRRYFFRLCALNNGRPPVESIPSPEWSLVCQTGLK